RAAEEAKRDGAKLINGGSTPRGAEYGNGYFVEPAIVEGLPTTHRLFKEELFVPFVVVAGVESFDEALKLANASEFGLCAGIYTKDRKEMQTFFDQIQAGVTYA